jgi:hypothetical protein
MEKLTAKEKAKELFNKYFYIIDNSHPLTDISISAKQCAIIAVDEIYKLDLKVGQYLDEENDKDNYYSYWEDVKHEIRRL